MRTRDWVPPWPLDIRATVGLHRRGSGDPSFVYGRDGSPSFAPVIATLPDGKRICAVADDDTLPTLAGRTLEGQTIQVTGAAPPTFRL